MLIAHRAVLIAIVVSLLIPVSLLGVERAEAWPGDPLTSSVIHFAEGRAGIGVLREGACDARITPAGCVDWVHHDDLAGNSYEYAYAVAYSPDAATVYLAGGGLPGPGGPAIEQDVIVRALDAVTGAIRWTLRHDGGVNGSDWARSIVVDPDSSRIYLAGGITTGLDREAFVAAIDAATGTIEWITTDSFNEMAEIVITPDGGTVLARHPGGHVMAFSAESGDRMWIRNFGTGSGLWDDANAFALSPDGGRVAVVGAENERVASGHESDLLVEVLDVATGARVWDRRVERFDDADRALDEAALFVAWTSDDAVHVVGRGETPVRPTAVIRLVLDGATGAVRFHEESRKEHYGGPVAFDVSPDGSVAYLAFGTYYADFWEVEAYAAVGPNLWTHHHRGVHPSQGQAIALMVSPDGRVVHLAGSANVDASSLDASVVGLDALTGLPLYAAEWGRPGADWLLAAALSPDGSAITMAGLTYSWNDEADLLAVAFRVPELIR